MASKIFLNVLIFISVLFVPVIKLTGEVIKPENKVDLKELKEKIVKTTHSIKLGNNKIEYDAYAGTLLLKGDEKKATGSFFFISYVRRGDYKRADRPVIFSFNGGPGSSSVWLHLGLLGPKRVLLN